ncbi:MAG: tRNA (adenosine(37)-N6)-threonylcarbamoyltransferase complex dimerization subunit type 1 TsaB [Planctomycetaceae bacterium]
MHQPPNGTNGEAGYLLAVETSGMIGSIALRSDDGEIIELLLDSEGRRHAQTLVADVQRLLCEQGVTPGEIHTVAVSIGPGSFTGLRVGLTFAKTFAWINKASLVTVDTLQAIAQQVPADIPVVAAISDAQRGELFWNEYGFDPESQLRCSNHPVTIIGPGQLSTSIPLSGPALTKQVSLNDRFQVVDARFWQPRAYTVAQIGAAQRLKDVVENVNALEPLYIRRSYAEEKRQP